MADQTETEIMLGVIDALYNGWTLCDDDDTEKYMVLVDENRAIKEDIKPLKSLIRKMEQSNLISTNDAYEEREYMDIFGELKPVPFVYMYEVTRKGSTFYRDNKV